MRIREQAGKTVKAGGQGLELPATLRRDSAEVEYAHLVTTTSAASSNDLGSFSTTPSLDHTLN